MLVHSATPLAICLALMPCLSLACDGPEVPRLDDAAEGGVSISVGRMADRVWEVRTLDADPIPDTADVWLTVTPDGKVSGRSGCNRYAGTADLDAGVMIFGPLAVTRMACDERTMELESAYLTALTEVRGFVVSPEGLWLTREDGSVAVCLGG